jgi:phytanoyl-CoA hydroxylase
MSKERAHYEEHGYAVLPKLVSDEAIDRTLALFRQDILPSKERFYRQNTNKYEQNRINSHGYVQQAFLDAHDYGRHPEFSRSLLDVFTDGTVLARLRDASGEDRVNLMQSMFFDQNAATSAHQDWWYLDSVPNGHLFAVWIALEDIDERAGRFYLMPGSHYVDLHSDTKDMPHSEWAKRMAEFVDENRSKLVAPALKKGDAIIWNSRTIHGALPTQDERFSRKSLTAHYLPARHEFGNLFTVKRGLRYKTYNGISFYKNQPDYSALNNLKFQIRWATHNHPRVLRALRVGQRALAKVRTALG